MKQAKTKLSDIHGDEVVHLHQDVLDADLTASEKVMMAVLRKRAYFTGRITVHYPEIAGLARMPLSTVKNKGGVIERLRDKGWIRGAVKDGACITMRMSPGWTSKSGEPSDFDGGSCAEPVPPYPEEGSTESVPASTESVPGSVLNRYCAGTETVPPSENKERVKSIENKVLSGAPVALTGSGSGNHENAGAPPKTGAPQIQGEAACGALTESAAPALTPALERKLVEEGRLWTEQVAEYIGMNSKASWGNEVRLDRPGDQKQLVVKRLKPEGSTPWPDDVSRVYEFAAAMYPKADPVMAFRAVIRHPARFTAVRQQIYEHSLRMQKSQGYVRPRIKLVSLLRLDNAGKDVPENVRTLAGEEVGLGRLLERAHGVVFDYRPAARCDHAADAGAEAVLRAAIDPRGRLDSPCWDGCWKEASARFAAAHVPVSAYRDYIWREMTDASGYESTPVLWLMDSVDVADLEAFDIEIRENGEGFCGNWGCAACGGDAPRPAVGAGSDEDAAATSQEPCVGGPR